MTELKPLATSLDNRKFNHKRFRRKELSKEFKVFDPVGDGKDASLNLNIWLLTSKKKKNILFKAQNKDFIHSKTKFKHEFTSKDFDFKTNKHECKSIHKFITKLQFNDIYSKNNRIGKAKFIHQDQANHNGLASKSKSMSSIPSLNKNQPHYRHDTFVTQVQHKI